MTDRKANLHSLFLSPGVLFAIAFFCSKVFLQSVQPNRFWFRSHDTRGIDRKSSEVKSALILACTMITIAPLCSSISCCITSFSSRCLYLSSRLFWYPSRISMSLGTKDHVEPTRVQSTRANMTQIFVRRLLNGPCLNH